MILEKIQTQFHKKTEVHFSRYLTPNMTISSFFKILLTTFCLTFHGGFLRIHYIKYISEISTTWGISA